MHYDIKIFQYVFRPSRVLTFRNGIDPRVPSTTTSSRYTSSLLLITSHKKQLFSGGNLVLRSKPRSKSKMKRKLEADKDLTNVAKVQHISRVKQGNRAA